MQLSVLVDAISDIVQDKSYTDAIITGYINEAVLAVATGEMLAGRFDKSRPLPYLYKTDTVATDTDGIQDLPSDFNRDVIMVVNADGESIPIEASPRKFLKDNPKSDAGDVRICSVLGDRLLYRDIPSTAETLTIHYYRTPDTLVSDTDAPSCIPEHLQRKLVIGHVCREIYKQIEDGIEGRKVNTDFYTGEYMSGFADPVFNIDPDGDPVYIDNEGDSI